MSSETGVDRPNSDILAEGVRIAAAAADVGIQLRLAGGVGIAVRCPSAATQPLRRSYADIDAVTRAADRRAVTALMNGLGYQADEGFNVLQGARRLMFWDTTNGRQVDVFIDQVEMCHRIDLRHRLDVHDRTLSLADLLLLKLQIVETNRKDLVDLVTLLADHPLRNDESGINVRYITGIAGDDWGLWRTTTMIARRAGEFAGGLEHLNERAAVVQERVDELISAMDTSEKTRRWRWRARIGDRKRWHDLPEEVG